jgi:hypothetical protein
MVMLDADVAGCVETWFKSSSDLDIVRMGALRSCLDDPGIVLPQLSDPEEISYYAGLQDLATSVLYPPRARPQR